MTDRDRQIYCFRPSSMKKLDENIVVVLVVVVVVESCYLHVYNYNNLLSFLSSLFLFYQVFFNLFGKSV